MRNSEIPEFHKILLISREIPESQNSIWILFY